MVKLEFAQNSNFHLENYISFSQQFASALKFLQISQACSRVTT